MKYNYSKIENSITAASIDSRDSRSFFTDQISLKFALDRKNSRPRITYFYDLLTTILNNLNPIN